MTNTTSQTSRKTITSTSQNKQKEINNKIRAEVNETETNKKKHTKNQ
jgi:hypothetical protein